MNVTMTKAFETAAKTIADAVLADALARLSEKYGFDLEEATRFLSVTIVKEPIPLMNLPWNGKVHEGCKAISYNQGLFTQCPLSCVEGTNWCKRCTRNLVDGKPKYGDVDDRNACDMMEYKVGTKQVIPYINFMKRKKYTMDYVLASAEHRGIDIHPDQFVERKKSGRPGRLATTMVSPDHDEPAQVPEDDSDEETQVAPRSPAGSPPRVQNVHTQESDEEPEGSEEEEETPQSRVEQSAPPAQPAPPAPQPAPPAPRVETQSQTQTRPILAPLTVPREEDGEVSEEEELTGDAIAKMTAPALRLLAEKHGLETRVGTKLLGKEQLVRSLKEKLNL